MHSVTRVRRKHKQDRHTSNSRPAFDRLLAERARDECYGPALRAGRTARHPHFGRTYLSCRHIETLPKFEALRLAHDVGGSDAIGRAIRRELTFLMATDG